MKARILELDSDEHRAVQALLPWYANGTLDRADTARVEAHLPGCARCQGDVAWQERLRQQSPVDLTGEEAAQGVEHAWSAMRGRLGPQTGMAHPSDATERKFWPRRRWRRWWVAAQAGIVLTLALGVFIGTGPMSDYHGLGEAPGATAANAVVFFKPEATEMQIRAALRAADARIVGGPTVMDAYLLHLATPGPRAMARLRAQRAVQRAESLAPGVTP